MKEKLHCKDSDQARPQTELRSPSPGQTRDQDSYGTFLIEGSHPALKALGCGVDLEWPMLTTWSLLWQLYFI